MTHEKPTLRQNLEAGTFVSAPGVFEMISALIADRMGFTALYMTGYGTVASYLGLPDAGLATYTDMVNRVSTMCGKTTTPLIADGDTGYGGLLNVEHTVKGYERAGAAAIQLEDQEYPKKCGHTLGRRVIPIEDAAMKIRVAVDARDSHDFLIIARTDARTSLGLDEALRRGEAFAKAGADIIFIESPETVEELRRVGETFSDQLLLANMVQGGRTPLLTKQELVDLGFNIAIFPGAGFLSAGLALRQMYQHILETGSSAGASLPVDDFINFNELMGFPEVWAFDERWAKAAEAAEAAE